MSELLFYRICVCNNVLFLCLVAVRQNCVVSAITVVVFKSDISARIASIPSYCAGKSTYAACHRSPIGAAQVTVKPVVAAQHIIWS